MIRRLIFVIWDWNGTLLDDSPLACAVLNEMLVRRALPTITLERYREIYEHPVQRIYERTGFDLSRESFAAIAHEWHEAYAARVSYVPLQPDALWALQMLQARDVVQTILSALPHQLLLSTLRARQLDGYFSRVMGLEDNLGRSKTDNGQVMMDELAIDTSAAVMIGDSTHDAQTAAALGLPCLLVDRGSESHARLISTGCPVFQNFQDLFERLIAQVAV